MNLDIQSEKRDILKNAIWQRVKKAQKRCRSRLLDEGDVETFLCYYEDLAAYAKTKGEPLKKIYLRIDGGGVPGSYGYSAKTTAILLRDGKLEIGRVNAQQNNREEGVCTGGVYGKGNGGIRTLN